MPDTYSIIEPAGEGWQIATIAGVRQARRPAGLPLLRKAWVTRPGGPLQPADLGDRCPAALVGKRIVCDQDGSADPLPGGSLGDYPAEPDAIDVEAATATWSRPAVEPASEAAAAAWAGLGVAAKRRIEEAAEASRMRFLTPGDGKAMTYREKLAEWKRWTADPQSELPFATAEAAVRDCTVADLMAIWAVHISAWAGTIGPAIEALEQGAKLAVDAAVAAEDMSALAAAEAVEWPSPD